MESYLTTTDGPMTQPDFHKDSNTVKSLRWLCFLSVTAIAGWTLYYKPIWALALTFTNWTVWVTQLYFVVALWYQHAEKSSLKLKVAHHLLFQIQTVFNVIVMVIYWFLLYKHDMARPEL